MARAISASDEPAVSTCLAPLAWGHAGCIMPNGIDLILADHQTVRALFEQFDASPDPVLMRQVVDVLKTHDDVEQAALYPMMWSILGDGNLNQRCEIAHSRMRTQIELISTLSGPPQIEAFRALRELATGHMADEERDVLPAISERANGQQLEVLGARILRANSRG